MSYRYISAETKVEIVLNLLKGESSTKLEDEFTIPKKTMYFWKTQAIESLYNLFEYNPPGPKSKSKLRLLNGDTLSQEENIYKDKCPDCREGKIVKNGFYSLTNGDIIQRLKCKKCSIQIKVKKKN